MTINVTQDDITKGVRHSPSSCPIARAFRRAGYWASVGLHRVDIGDGQKVPLPTRAQKFIKTYDAGEVVEPLAFFIDEKDIFVLG